MAGAAVAVTAVVLAVAVVGPDFFRLWGRNWGPRPRLLLRGGPSALLAGGGAATAGIGRRFPPPGRHLRKSV